MFLYRHATNVLGFWFTLEGDLSGYTDEDRISEFAAEAILWATDAGIFQGFGWDLPVLWCPDPGAACQDPDGFEPVRRQLSPGKRNPLSVASLINGGPTAPRCEAANSICCMAGEGVDPEIDGYF